MPRPLSPARSLLRLLENSATPLFAVDSRRRIVFAARALGDWIGISADRLVGQSCDYHPGGDDPLAQAAAALAPPPEAFLGQIEDGSVSRLASGKLPFERCAARFVKVAGNDAEDSLLPVFVQLQSHVPPDGPASSLAPPRLHAQLLDQRSQLGKRFHISQLLGESDAIARVRRQVRVAAESPARVLIVGKTGSGREHVAKTIHYARPAAQLGSLVPIACPLVDAEEMQAALASCLRRQHEAQPTAPPVALLLDVDRLNASGQQELAGFLALPNIELRTLATSSVALERLAAKGKFRRDLAYTLGTLTIALPPLAKRSVDIPLLAQHFVEEANRGRNEQLSGLQPAAQELLSGLPWPGNIDELAKAVREACNQATGPLVTAANFPAWVHLAKNARAHPPRRHEAIQIDKFLAEIERELMVRALAAASGNKSRAAQLLGVSRPRLLRRLSQLGLIAPPVAEEPVVFEPLPEEP